MDHFILISVNTAGWNVEMKGQRTRQYYFMKLLGAHLHLSVLVHSSNMLATATHTAVHDWFSVTPQLTKARHLWHTCGALQKKNAACPDFCVHSTMLAAQLFEWASLTQCMLTCKEQWSGNGPYFFFSISSHYSEKFRHFADTTHYANFVCTSCLLT